MKIYKKQKKEPPCKQSGPSGWDIGKLPNMMINEDVPFVNRRFWWKKAKGDERGRFSGKYKIFVNYIQKVREILFKPTAVCYNADKDKRKFLPDPYREDPTFGKEHAI